MGLFYTTSEPIEFAKEKLDILVHLGFFLSGEPPFLSFVNDLDAYPNFLNPVHHTSFISTPWQAFTSFFLSLYIGVLKPLASSTTRSPFASLYVKSATYLHIFCPLTMSSKGTCSCRSRISPAAARSLRSRYPLASLPEPNLMPSRSLFRLPYFPFLRI